MLSLPEIRYLLPSLPLWVETDTVRRSMPALLVALLAALRSFARSRLELGAEIVALRHQPAVLQRQMPRRPRLLAPIASCGPAVAPVAELARRHPDRHARHRRGLASSRVRPLLVLEIATEPGWPPGSGRRHTRADPADARGKPLWGAPRIHGELQKLGPTVAKYLGRRRCPPSPTWRTFLTNHVAQLASVDFFTVPTAMFRVLFVFVVLSHDRRRIVHFNVTTNPTAAWTAQQIREAWPWDTAPRLLVRDRDAIYGPAFQRVTQASDIDDVRTAPRAPWLNPFVERVIGSLRRDCLDHVIVWNERSLRRHLQQYLAYYHVRRTHLSLDKDAPVHGRASPRPAVRSSRSRTSAACITTTNVAPLDRHAQRRNRLPARPFLPAVAAPR
jgi:putative transposase